MKTMDRDVVGGGFLIVLGIAGIIGSQSIENMVVTKLSGAFFPTVLFAIITMCGAGLVFEGMRRTEKVPCPKFKYANLASIIVALAAYVELMQFVGFIISTFVFMLVAMWLFGERRKLVLLTVALATAVIVFLLFTYAFKVVLPGIPGLDF